MSRRPSRYLAVLLVALVLAHVFPGSAEAQATWRNCFAKFRPGVSQLGGPLIPGAKFVADHSVTQFNYFYVTSRSRSYAYDIDSPNVFAWHMARYPFAGGTTFRVPSVVKGSVYVDCARSSCSVQYQFNDRTKRTKTVSCPPEVGENAVNAALVPKAPLSDANNCAGFTGNFMTTWGPMRLDNGNGTYVFRTKNDNPIQGTVTPTATGWTLTGRWRDLMDSGNFRFEMDRATGNFFGTYSKGDAPVPQINVNESAWSGQCRATMPTELSIFDDQASRDAVTNPPPIVAVQPNAADVPLAAPGTFTPLDPTTVPCGGFNGKMWSSAFGEIVLANGIGTYKFGRDPEAPLLGTVTPTPTGWVLTGTYGSGAAGGTIRLEQDSKGSFAGRYKGTTSGGGAVSGSCTPG